MTTYADVLAARERVRKHLPRTPLHTYPGLCELLGAEVWVKHENHQPVGSFKVRGGVNLAEQLDADARRAGLYTASTGNHGQSIAYAGRLGGAPVTVAVPRGANPDKMAAMRALGADVCEHGDDFDEAREWIAGVAEEKGGRFIGPTEPELIAGVATYADEIFDDLPDPDFLFVPVGAGSGAAGCCIVAAERRPETRVIAVQAEAAPAAQRSWRRGELVGAEMRTRAEGLATRVAFENTQKILREHLHDFALVSEAALVESVRLLLDHTHNLAEEAGAAALAGALQRSHQLTDRRVVVVLSGGNLTRRRLMEILS